MKKSFFLLAITVLFMSTAYGSFIEAKVSYFLPSEQVFRDVHGNGISYGGEIGLTIWNGLNLWAGVNYFKDTGKLSYTEEETELWIIPFYGGFKFSASISMVRPYAGIGVGYFHYKERNFIGTVEKGGLGFVGQVGIAVTVVEPIFIDIQGNYSYCKVKPAEVDANLGGFRAAVGLGFEF